MKVSDEVFTALDWLKGIQVIAVKTGKNESEDVIIIDGIIRASQSHLSEGLDAITKYQKV